MEHAAIYWHVIKLASARNIMPETQSRKKYYNKEIWFNDYYFKSTYQFGYVKFEHFIWFYNNKCFLKCVMTFTCTDRLWSSLVLLKNEWVKWNATMIDVSYYVKSLKNITC